jgi:hypothetical protein
MKMKSHFIITLALLFSFVFVSCSSGEKAKNHAKEAAARYWQDKAYPGKGFDIQVIEAEATDGGYRVKGIVDGETRVGIFSPETETFSEGYYSLAHERDKKIAELEQENKFYKEKAENLEKENYKLKVQLDMKAGGSTSSEKPAAAPAPAAAKPEEKSEEKKSEEKSDAK